MVVSVRLIRLGNSKKATGEAAFLVANEPSM
jgi:hypothetical protein